MENMARNILKSEYTSIPSIVEKTLPEYYLERAQFHLANGKSHWLVDGLTDEKRYYSRFEAETRKIASAFCKLGLVKGDVVIFMNRDLAKSTILIVGVWRANGVLRASYPEDDEKTILHRVLESQVKFIVCEEDAVNVCRHVSQRVPWKLTIITVNRSCHPDIPSLAQFLDEDDGESCPELLVAEDDPALILSTSGTTGLPKGAVHTHKSVLYQNRSHERGGFLSHKPNLMATKATHISGTMSGLVCLATGKVGVVISSVNLHNILSVTEKYQVGFIFIFPTFLTSIANSHGNGYDLSSLEVILTGGMSVTPAMQEALKKLPNLRDVIVLYGMTEINICTTSAVLRDDEEKNGVHAIRDLPHFSIGKVFPDTELRVLDLTTDAVLGPNQKGEICLKSPSVFQGYLNNPKATQEAFVDGFMRTGDVGYFDEKGFVYIVDRIKEIFKYCGDHISPSEVESVVAEHPAVEAVCVVGVPHENGHLPKAFVTVKDTVTDRIKLAEDIMIQANRKLPDNKHLRGGVVILEELPKEKTGKVSRQLLKEY